MRPTHDRKSKSGFEAWLLESDIRLAIGERPLDSDTRINLNLAARDELMRLPAIGKTMANRIIEHRPYSKPEDLLNVPGIGKKTFDGLQMYLVVTAAH